MGMHLLQKMGWRPGEGLGKDKTGSLQPLLLEVKNDRKGLVSGNEVHILNLKNINNSLNKITICRILECEHQKDHYGCP